jgi:tetratricopeptide (TPR) repeat protein
MSKRLSSEDMEQDVLIEYSSRAIHYYQTNKATVIGGSIAIVVLIGMAIGYFIYSGQQEQKAQVMLGIAEQALLEGDLTRALYGNESDFTLGFVQIANNFGRTDAGNLANYYAAVTEYELGNAEEALVFIQRFRAPRSIVGVGPISLHGVILSDLGEYEAAAAKFIEAANWSVNESTTPNNLLQAAQAYIAAGNHGEARRIVERIITDYPQSQEITEAQRLSGYLANR